MVRCAWQHLTQTWSLAFVQQLKAACPRHLAACSWPGAALPKVAINSSPTNAGGALPSAVSPRGPASPGSPRLKLGAHRGSKGLVSDKGAAVERSADSVLNALAKAEEAAAPKVSSCHFHMQSRQQPAWCKRSADSVLNALAEAEEAAAPKVSSRHFGRVASSS